VPNGDGFDRGASPRPGGEVGRLSWHARGRARPWAADLRLVGLPFGWFALATALGVIPKAFAFTYAGATLATRPAWLDALILAGIFGMLLIVPLVIRHVRRSGVPALPADAGSADVAER
jgi:hypothetical protein